MLTASFTLANLVISSDWIVFGVQAAHPAPLPQPPPPIQRAAACAKGTNSPVSLLKYPDHCVLVPSINSKFQAFCAWLVCAALLINTCTFSGNALMNHSLIVQSAFLAICAYFCMSSGLPISTPLALAAFIRLFKLVI